MDRPDGFEGLPPPPEPEPAAIEATAAPHPTTRQLVLAVVAGLAAAIVGGIAWGLLVDATGSEFGIAAIGIGILTGFAVVAVTRGSSGVPLQVIAALAAALGVLWGKYFAFVKVGQGVIDERLPGSGFTLPLFSGDTFQLFRDGFGELFSGWDIAWVVFAIYTAWRIPQGKGFGRRFAGGSPPAGG
ncbi:MAG TPA: hypothetical protein VFZ75_01790 [Actinomycetota bacterium]|nr:hypothetical protein [Actinomycetota bacterium]